MLFLVLGGHPYKKESIRNGSSAQCIGLRFQYFSGRPMRADRVPRERVKGPEFEYFSDRPRRADRVARERV
jgi:hypothetical protein